MALKLCTPTGLKVSHRLLKMTTTGTVQNLLLMDGGCTGQAVPCLISPLSVKCAVSWTFCLQALNIKAVYTMSAQTECFSLSPACQSRDGNVCIGSEPMMPAQGPAAQVPDVWLIMGIVVVILTLTLHTP